jgi:hypothetical protein
VEEHPALWAEIYRMGIVLREAAEERGTGNYLGHK